MRAASGVDVTFDVLDNDFSSNYDDTVVTDVSKIFTANSKAGLLSYDGDLEYVGTDLMNVEVKVVTYVNNATGTHKVDTQTLKTGSAGVLDVSTIETSLKAVDGGLTDGDEIVFEISTMIDYYGNGDLYVDKAGKGGKSDDIDDRDQRIVSLTVEGWSDRTNAGTGKYSDAVKYVADDDDDVTDLIEGLTSYDEKNTVKDEDGNRVTYRLVYYVNGEEIEATWEVCEDKDEGRIVFGKKQAEESTPVYDELDTNHDGVVSCDEAHGEGWVWNEDKKACVYTGSTTSTVIVNTATK